MGTLTPELGLYKPDVGETDWGALVDANWDLLDARRVPGVDLRNHGYDPILSDNTAAVQAAIDAVSNASPTFGGAIWCGSGPIKCAGTINAPARRGLRFMGEAGIAFNEGTTGTYFASTQPGQTLFNFNNAAGTLHQNGPTFENLSIIDLGGSSSLLLDVRNINHVHMRRVGLVGHSDLTSSFVNFDGTADDCSWHELIGVHMYKPGVFGMKWTSSDNTTLVGGSSTGGKLGYWLTDGASDMKFLGVKGDAGTSSGYRLIKCTGHSNQFVAVTAEITSGSNPLAIIELDGATTPSGYRNQVHGGALSGNATSGQYGLSITANAHNTVVYGMSTVGFATGYGYSDLGVATKSDRSNSGTDTNPWISLGGVLIYTCTGSPEGVLTAPKSSLALRIDGGAGTCFWVKESGTGNTGWVAK